MSEQDQNNLVHTVGYDEPIGWPEVVQEAFLHGATLSSEDLERRRRRRSHHTVPVYLLRLFSEREERLHAFDRETQLAFETGPRRLLCEKGANTVVGQDGKLRADVEGVFAYIDSLLSKTVKRIVKAMRRMRNQLIHERRDPGRIDLQLVKLSSGSGTRWRSGAVRESGTRTTLTSGTWTGRSGSARWRR